ncbi:MAG: hypothetical protein J3K34DRAFT_448318, partial [Monoraphidium minutum]
GRARAPRRAAWFCTRAHTARPSLRVRARFIRPGACAPARRAGRGAAAAPLAPAISGLPGRARRLCQRRRAGARRPRRRPNSQGGPFHSCEGYTGARAAAHRAAPGAPQRPPGGGGAVKACARRRAHARAASSRAAAPPARTHPLDLSQGPRAWLHFPPPHYAL